MGFSVSFTLSRHLFPKAKVSRVFLRPPVQRRVTLPPGSYNLPWNYPKLHQNLEIYDFRRGCVEVYGSSTVSSSPHSVFFSFSFFFGLNGTPRYQFRRRVFVLSVIDFFVLVANFNAPLSFSSFFFPLLSGARFTLMLAFYVPLSLGGSFNVTLLLLLPFTRLGVRFKVRFFISFPLILVLPFNFPFLSL